MEVVIRGTENGEMGAALDLESEDQLPALLAGSLPEALFPNLGNGRTPAFLGCIDDSVHYTRYCL